MIKTLSVKKYGKNYKISEHFTLGEFQCRDGSDTVKYSTELLVMLEKLRAYGNFTVSINSGYRTPAYNRKIGGASRSKHTEGYAADVVVKRDGKVINAKLVCCLCQTLGFKGIGYISANAVHLDMRPSGSYRGDERSGYGNNVTDFYRYFNASTCDIAELKAPQEPVKPAEKEEETEMVYKDLSEVPDWGAESVKLRINLGGFSGENITESMLRVWVVEDRENPYYSDLDDVPAYWKEDVSSMLRDGAIAGDGIHQIGMRRNDLRNLIITKRMINKIEAMLNVNEV